MERIKKQQAYGFTALLTLFSLILMIYALKIYPFGDKTFLWTDADQYFSFQHYFGSIPGKNSVFYSWNNALGGNAFAQLAYYAFSPFNVVFLFLNDHMMLASHLVAYAKIVIASLTFFYCLNYLHKDNSFLMKSALSLCYSFMGYMIFNGWNVSWMDGVVFLPIIYIGIIKIIEGKNPLQYAVSLCAAVISNFYIGFMLCIGSFILYVASLLLREKSFIEGLKKSFVRYAFFSLSGVGMGTFVLIPAFFGLPGSRSESIKELIKEMHFTITPINIISGLFTGQVNSISSNAPLIYVGILPFLLVVVFFVSKKASARKKMVYAALIVTFMLSFDNSFLDTIWHGLSYNAWFNYRYSFLFSFVLLLIAYDAYHLVMADSVSKNEYMQAGAVLLLIAALVVSYSRNKLRPIGFFSDIVLICIMVGLFMIGYQHKRTLMVFMVFIMTFCSVANGYCYLHDPEIIGLQYLKSTYDSMDSLIRSAKNTIQDDSFYRLETNSEFGRCDGSLFDFNGVSNFSSTESLDKMDYIKKLGVWHTQIWWSRYTTDMPEASESLFGIKYLLTDTLHSKNYEKIGSYEETGFYRNPWALPVLFPSGTSGVNPEEMNSFDLLNKIWKSINGIDKNVFEANTIENLSTEDQNILQVTVNKSGSVYISFPESSYSVLKAEGPTIDNTINYKPFKHIHYIGELSEGDTFDLIITLNEDNTNYGYDYDLDKIVCYTEDKSVIAENSELINSTDMTIDEISSSHLEMTYNGSRKCISTTIPYDENWSIYDNGQKVQLQKNWNCFISFELDDTGTHKISLIYRPKGFTAGVLISLVSVLLIVLYEVILKLHLFRRSHST